MVNLALKLSSSLFTIYLGLLWHDQYFEPAPEVTEALRRLNLKEPWLYDQRKMRLSRAHTLAMHNEILPKDQWTQWNDVCLTILNICASK